MPREAGIWTDTFRVHTYETDPQGRASIQTLCNYFQEAAGNHAEALDVSIGQLMAQDQTWVLSRLHLRIDAYPGWGDAVAIETWPTGEDGLYVLRDFLLHVHPQDGGAPRTVGCGTSAWLIVDLQRKRPARIPPKISTLVWPERPLTLPETPTRIKPPPHVVRERRFHVRFSDLDINRHVNNARYAAWAAETVPNEVLRTRRLREIALLFRAETTYGDAVVGRSHPSSGGEALSFDHRLLRESDGRDVALARTRWVVC